MTTEEMNEIMNDMRQEMLREARQEERMRNDIDMSQMVSVLIEMAKDGMLL